MEKTVNLNTAINEAILAYLVDQKYIPSDATEVVSWEDRTEGSGGCETCYFEWAVIDVQYRVASAPDELRLFTYGGSFVDLIRVITRQEEVHGKVYKK